jgi:hypothetical protein
LDVNIGFSQNLIAQHLIIIQISDVDKLIRFVNTSGNS